MTVHDVLVLKDPVKPLPLRKIPADAARLQSDLCRVMEPLMLGAGGANVFAGLDAPRAPAADAPWLGFTLDGAAGAIQVPWGLARRLAGLPVGGAIPEDAALLIEEALASALDEVEAALGIALRLTGLSEAVPEHPVATTVNLQGKDGGGKLVQLRQAAVLSAEAAGRFVTALQARRRPRADLPGLDLRLTREVGAVAMSLAELRSLEPGDAIEIDETSLVILQDQRVANAVPEADGLRLASGFVPLTQKELPMSDAPEMDATLDDIDIRLSFRAGEASMPLKALRDLAPGAIIEMTDPPTAEVEILANGRVVGTGELIDVAGRRAVQIRRLFAG